MAGSLLGRIHNAHRIDLKGEGIRRKRAKSGLTQTGNPEIIIQDEQRQPNDQPSNDCPELTETAVRFSEIRRRYAWPVT
ncbi:hypothetical protein D2T32_16000 [Sinirhodobacter populi]|nr:hypothetical protein D2T32_16000 [Sinirhodobacter populi]